MIQLLQYEPVTEPIVVIEFDGSDEQGKEIVKNYNGLNNLIFFRNSKYILLDGHLDPVDLYAGDFLVLGKGYKSNGTPGYGVIGFIYKDVMSKKYKNKKTIRGHHYESL